MEGYREEGGLRRECSAVSRGCGVWCREHYDNKDGKGHMPFGGVLKRPFGYNISSDRARQMALTTGI